MPREDERRAVGEEEATFDRDACGGNRIDLRQERIGVHDHAGPDHRRRSPDDSRGKEVEREVPVAELDGVSRVVPAVVARHDLEAVGEQIDEMIAERNYARALESFAALAPELEQFFEDVMVMVDDAAVRSNRMSLLRKIGNAVLKIGDVTKIVVDRSEYRA